MEHKVNVRSEWHEILRRETEDWSWSHHETVRNDLKCGQTNGSACSSVSEYTVCQPGWGELCGKRDTSLWDAASSKCLIEPLAERRWYLREFERLNGTIKCWDPCVSVCFIWKDDASSPLSSGDMLTAAPLWRKWNEWKRKKKQLKVWKQLFLLPDRDIGPSDWADLLHDCSHSTSIWCDISVTLRQLLPCYWLTLPFFLAAAAADSCLPLRSHLPPLTKSSFTHQFNVNHRCLES